MASVTSGVLFSYISIIFGKYYFSESKDPCKTRTIKFSQKLSILHYHANVFAAYYNNVTNLKSVKLNSNELTFMGKTAKYKAFTVVFVSTNKVNRLSLFLDFQYRFWCFEIYQQGLDMVS